MHRFHRTIPWLWCMSRNKKAAAQLKTDNFSCQVEMENVMMGETVTSHPALIYDNVEKDCLHYTPDHCNFVAVLTTPIGNKRQYESTGCRSSCWPAKDRHGRNFLYPCLIDHL